ncbi:ankyrin repeat domain-containing protein [Achromobacter sp.]|uniref:ankyrin repeat domain-containing protein n=1 Tax=Achromobacter sp. TaxID=134375 RepID=UPI0028A87F8E|nr:ankyrin repeat domain-containing protein [Achromobacter sp.]
MATRYASAQNAFLSCCRGGLLALAIGLAAPAAQAANPGDWWVYVANDYPDDIKDLLAQGSDPNVRYKNGQPAIMRAVVDNAWKVFDVLAADKRTDVNAENPAGETPLMYLAIAGQTERAKKLIARGAQVNRLGWTPLHYAASKGQMEMARLLLANKAMVNAPAPNGETPLMMAALSGRKPMVELLIRSGADVTTQDTKGQDAATWAATGKSEALAAELTAMIQKEEDAKRKRRASARPGSQQEVGTSPAAGQAPAPAPQPAPAAQAPERTGGVKGVSGVGLSDYEKPPAP